MAFMDVDGACFGCGTSSTISSSAATRGSNTRPAPPAAWPRRQVVERVIVLAVQRDAHQVATTTSRAEPLLAGSQRATAARRARQPPRRTESVRVQHVEEAMAVAVFAAMDVVVTTSDVGRPWCRR